MNKPHPTSLNNPPLLEMFVEIRFRTKLPGDAVYGFAYPVLIKHFKESTGLPVLNMPADIRNTDQNLRYQPHYQFSGGSPLQCQIGPSVIMFKYQRYAPREEIAYPGWSKYIQGFVVMVLEDLFSILQIEMIERIGIRYLDFFNDDKVKNFFDMINPVITFPGRTISKAGITCTIDEGEMAHIINLSDNATFQQQVGDSYITQRKGSLIDIDTAITGLDTKIFMANCADTLSRMHAGNKTLFYEIMKDSLAELYEPIYDKE